MTPKEERSNLTAAWLRENMDYSPDTGLFSWKKTGFGRTVGKILGSRVPSWNQDKAYMTMKVDGTVYYAHRLAWLYVYGAWPDGLLDHIDGDPSNNAIENLRPATSAQNAARRPTKRSIAPSRGVFPHGPGYVARIHHGGKRHYLGYFPTAEEARAVYEEAAKRIHGDFAHAGQGDVLVRGDYLNVPKCEMCGKDGWWGAGDIRRDTTPMGKIRGALCLNCWSFVSLCAHDKKELQRMYRRAMKYIDSIDVFDEDDSRRTPMPEHLNPGG